MNERKNNKGERTVWVLFCYRRSFPYPGICYEQYPVTVPASIGKYADQIVSRCVAFNVDYVKANYGATEICHTTNESRVNDVMKFMDELMSNTIE